MNTIQVFTNLDSTSNRVYIHQIVFEFVSKLVEFDRVSSNSDSLHSATWYATFTMIKTKSTLNKRTSCLLYHGLHSWTVFSPSFFNVSLVAVTGILPSVSPLVTDGSNYFSKEKKIRQRERWIMIKIVISWWNIYLNTHTRRPPATSFLITGSMEAGASLQNVILSLQATHSKLVVRFRCFRNLIS